jgi:hypothetical protein
MFSRDWPHSGKDDIAEQNLRPKLLFWITALTIQHRAPCRKLCDLKLAIDTHHLAMEQHCLLYWLQVT